MPGVDHPDHLRIWVGNAYSNDSTVFRTGAKRLVVFGITYMY